MSWQKVKLGQFLKNREGRYKPNDKAIQGLKRIDKINFSGTIFLSDKPSNTDMILVKKGDLVISGINVEKGAMNIYNGEEDVVATIHYSSYEFDEEKIDIDFLTNFLKSLEFKKALKEQVPGGIKTEIKPKHILPLIVEIPSDVKEQKRIVKELIENNLIIENASSELTHQLDLIKQLRQAFLREAMQGKLVNCTNTKETGHQLIEKIKAEKVQLITEKKLKREKELTPISEDEIPFEIPEHWAWCRLGNLRDFKYTLSYGVLVPGNDIEGGIPLVRVQDLDNSNLNIPPTKHISIDIERKFSKTRLLGGEILICVVGSIGKIAFTNKSWIGANIARAVCRFMPNANLNSNFIYNVLLSPYVQDFFEIQKRSINPTLNVNVLETTLIPIPPIHEQEQIVAKLEELMAFCDGLEQSIKESQGYNEKLLQEVLREALQGDTVGLV